MHYVFKSKADADLRMMQPAAEQLFAVIGREPAPRGILEAAAIPQAMRAIETAIAAERARGGDRDGASDDGEERGGESVSLARRAWPMLQMMKRAAADGADIVWGV